MKRNILLKIGQISLFFFIVSIFIFLPLQQAYAGPAPAPVHGGTSSNGTSSPPCVNDPDPCGHLESYNGTQIQCPAKLACVVTIFPHVISAAFQIITSVIVIVVILAGIKFLRSGGDAKQVEGAWKMVTYAIIGFVIVFGSYFIINIISFITGVHCIQLFGFTNCQ